MPKYIPDKISDQMPENILNNNRILKNLSVINR